MPQPSFKLSGLERTLLVFYHTVPVGVRAEVGRRLFDAWLSTAKNDDREETERRWIAANKRFRGGSLLMSTFDDLRAGEPIAAGHSGSGEVA